jgi:hypothetical protein
VASKLASTARDIREFEKAGETGVVFMGRYWRLDALMTENNAGSTHPLFKLLKRDSAENGARLSPANFNRLDWAFVALESGCGTLQFC